MACGATHKNIDICFTIIKNDKNFSNSIEVIEKLLEVYPEHKNNILNSSMEWLEIMINHDENCILHWIVYSYICNKHKDFLSIIDRFINSNDFLNIYKQKIGDKTISKEKKLFIAIFLYFINKENTDVLDILIDNPLKTFNFIVENRFALLIFIKEDMNRSTNIFNTLESLLKEKRIHLSYENSHKMLEVLIDHIGSGLLLEEVKNKLLNFITKYYIENKNIDLKHRKILFRPSRFYKIQDSNKTIKKFLKEQEPRLLTENRIISNNQSKPIEKVEKKLLDILKDKNVNSWDIKKSIKENWNKDDFLASIQDKDIELKNKKIMVESATPDNLIVLTEMIKNDNIELAVRRHIAKTLYEKGFYSDETINSLIEFMKDTDLEFILHSPQTPNEE